MGTKMEWIKKSKEYVKESVETVSAACIRLTKKEFMRRYGITEVEEKANQYHLDISGKEPFAICPVFFEKKENSINICSVCFALLILSKGVEELEFITQEEEKNNTELINCLINTIVLSVQKKSDSSDMYWPTSISTASIVESGTCNQTTVALSALLRVGFFDMNSEIDKDVIISRYGIAVNALSWLINIQQNNAWTYGENCKTIGGDPITYSVLSSHFCYETLKKYIEHFNSEKGSNEIVSIINSKILDRIHSSCKAFEEWAESKLKETNGVTKTNASHSHSILHTCLCFIIYCFDNKKLHTNILEDGLRYVLDNLDELEFTEEELLEAYNYTYETSDGRSDSKTDTYEIIPEYLFINFSTRLMKGYYSTSLTSSQKNKLKKANYIAYKKLFDKTTTFKFHGKDEHLVLQGVQLAEGKRFPIYGLYDLQLCLLELLNSSKGKNSISIIRKPINPILIRIVLIVLGIAAMAILLYVALKLDFNNTATGLLLAIMGPIGGAVGTLIVTSYKDIIKFFKG